MKKIEDYLHLYIGVDVESTGGKYMGKLVSVGINDQAIVVHPEGDQRGLFSYLSWLKPILRPLSDMTEEEMQECGNMIYDFSDDPELNT